MERLPTTADPEWRGHVERVLRVWGSYQVGIEHEAGGDDTKDKHIWFGDVLADHIQHTRNLNADSLEEWIDSILYQDFDLVLEDDSTYPTAHLLIEAHRYWRAGDRLRLGQLFDSLPSEERVNEARRASRREGGEEEEEMMGSGEESDSDGEEAAEEPGEQEKQKPAREQRPRNTTDEDGWTTVHRR